MSLFMELQTLGDRVLKKLAFDHVVHSIRRMNQKHKNEAKNRALQNVLFDLLQVCQSFAFIIIYGILRASLVLIKKIYYKWFNTQSKLI